MSAPNANGISPNVMPAVALVGGVGSIVYYAGWTALGRGMINGFYGLTGITYHGIRGIEAAILNGDIHNEVAKKALEEVIKHAWIALPAAGLCAAGFALRHLGSNITGDSVGRWLSSWTITDANDPAKSQKAKQ